MGGFFGFKEKVKKLKLFLEMLRSYIHNGIDLYIDGDLGRLICVSYYPPPLLLFLVFFFFFWEKTLFERKTLGLGD